MMSSSGCDAMCCEQDRSLFRGEKGNGLDPIRHDNMGQREAHSQPLWLLLLLLLLLEVSKKKTGTSF
jgi:hypothetical protein